MRDSKSKVRPLKATGTESPMHPAVMPERNDPSLGRDVQTKIGQQLRAIYDDVVNQGIPDRFVDLLNKLDKGKE
jgi:hypothetical protein